MRVTLIHNPTAGDGAIAADELRELLWEAGYDPHYRSTKEPDWESALAKPADLVIAAGGDGTVAKVATLLRTEDTVLAILPLGTANNIANAFGISASLREAVAQWSQAVPRNLDFWATAGAWGKHLIIEGCGLGAMAQAAAKVHARHVKHVDPVKKLALGREMLREMVQRMPSFELRARCDDTIVEGEFVLFEALNLPVAGPQLPLVKSANGSDGLLDIFFLRPEEREPFAEWLEAGAVQHWRTDAQLRCHGLHLEWKGPRLRLGDNTFWPDDNLFENEEARAQRETCEADLSRAPSSAKVLVPPI